MEYYIIVFFIIACISLIFIYQKIKLEDINNKQYQINLVHNKIFVLPLYVNKLSSLSESVFTWNYRDYLEYQRNRLFTDSILQDIKIHCNGFIQIEQVDSLCNMLEQKEYSLLHIMRTIKSKEKSDSLFFESQIPKKSLKTLTVTRKKKGLAGFFGKTETVQEPYYVIEYSELKKKTNIEIYNRILDNNEVSQLFPFRDFLYSVIDGIKSSKNRKDYSKLAVKYINTLTSLEETEMCQKQYTYINDFYLYYQKKLYGSENYGFDFSDMIYYSNLYINHIGTNTNLKFQYIIIDEYQDISEDRYILAKNVSTVNTAKVVAVGDDWQSIFSFAGSKIEYTYNFLSYFPTAKILKISKAYRNSRQLIKYSSDFIMKNTDQISKQLLSTKENPSPIKFVFFEEGKEYQKLKELILAIHKNNKNSHILILGRTNKIIDTMYEEPELIDDMETKVKYQGYDDIDIDGMTIHKSKGLTSDEVIIIGLDSRFPKPYYGDFWLKEIYKNNWYEEKIPFAEERRLFYVALTRTKNNVYLLVNKDADNRSPFINEIYNIMINNKESI